MANVINNDYFVPFFKFIQLEKVKSHGVSRTSIIFDTNLNKYLKVGIHSVSEFASINKFIDENNNSYEILDQDDEDETTKIRNSLAQIINNFEMSIIYMYGFNLEEIL
ncbi:hypothetical protein [Spiroplasma taiwanense]|uniref:Uncharacterized protein n=1 Tax=Spiroplasma taiwanense CT-1 TaxID=1276220 RepID=S5LYY3_9MOLU|nr:hypothetical protein [Spiroplasma taiwanense]AGR40902.1 hypothetical protein STAIW_v1c02310 [Spiroplasma taiwanense CT-1]